MSVPEIAVWSAMLGGLLTLALVALADALFYRKSGSLRNLVFVLVAGASCVVMTGLPDVLWPGLLPEWMMQGIKGSLGPLAGALALYYLGIWLGGNREDPTVYHITSWGAIALFIAGVGLGLLAMLATPTEFRELLLATAIVNFAAAVLGLIAALRAAALGDPLARWMTLACVGLAATVVGLYLRGLNVPGFGLGTWIATALIAVLYFLSCTALIIVRNRQQRSLTRLAGLKAGADPATGLPTGSMLLTEVEHAFWRAARLHGHSTLVYLNVRNLYELGQSAGHGVEHQIQAALAARIRRTAGFRCVVGLYEPRSFVVVIFSDKHHDRVSETVNRLRLMVGRSLAVFARDQSRHEFLPQLSLGVVTLMHPGRAAPLDVIHEAERRAVIREEQVKEKERQGGPSQPPASPPPPSVQDSIPTEPAPF